MIVSQEHLTKDIISDAVLTDGAPVKCPINPASKLEACENRGRTEECGKVDEKLYRSYVGRLNYLACMTRPDLMFSVSYLSQFLTCPHHQHLEAVRRVIRYLKGTAESRLEYRAGPEPTIGYSDADWGGCSTDRKSYTGAVIVLSGAPKT